MKNFILIALALLASQSILAQNNKKGISFSVKTGLTLANMYGEAATNETFLNGYSFNNSKEFYANHPASKLFKTGVNSSIFCDYRFSKYLSLGFGVSYIEKGAKINANKSWNSDKQAYEAVEGKITWNQNFTSLDFPITFYYPLKAHDVYVKGGLFTAFLKSSEEKGKITISGENYTYTNDRFSNEKEFGYFLDIGYLYALPNKIGHLLFEISWSRSLFNSAGADMIPNPQYYFNQTISANIGFRYTLKKKKN